jgi:hypothetical protein
MRLLQLCTSKNRYRYKGSSTVLAGRSSPAAVKESGQINTHHAHSNQHGDSHAFNCQPHIAVQRRQQERFRAISSSAKQFLMPLQMIVPHAHGSAGAAPCICMYGCNCHAGKHEYDMHRGVHDKPTFCCCRAKHMWRQQLQLPAYSLELQSLPHLGMWLHLLHSNQQQDLLPPTAPAAAGSTNIGCNTQRFCASQHIRWQQFGGQLTQASQAQRTSVLLAAPSGGAASSNCHGLQQR